MEYYEGSWDWLKRHYEREVLKNPCGEIALPVPAEEEKEFVWIDQSGNYYCPTDMKTSHVFFSIRLLWNHKSPAGKWLGEGRRFKLGPRFTNAYVKRAVRVLCAELRSRTDLDSGWFAQLDQMIRWADHNPEFFAPLATLEDVPGIAAYRERLG